MKNENIRPVNDFEKQIISEFLLKGGKGRELFLETLWAADPHPVSPERKDEYSDAWLTIFKSQYLLREPANANGQEQLEVTVYGKLVVSESNGSLEEIGEN